MKTFKQLNEISSGLVKATSSLPTRKKTHFSATTRSKGVAQVRRGGKSDKLLSGYRTRMKLKKKMKLDEMSEKANRILNEIAASPVLSGTVPTGKGLIGWKRAAMAAAGWEATAALVQEPIRGIVKPLVRKITYPVRALHRAGRGAFPGSSWFARYGGYHGYGPRALSGLDPGFKFTSKEEQEA